MEKVWNSVKCHGLTVLRGLIRTAHGTLTAGLMAIAIYGFIVIRSEAGYAAVCDFIAACATMVVALCNVYYIGRKKGKRARA